MSRVLCRKMSYQPREEVKPKTVVTILYRSASLQYSCAKSKMVWFTMGGLHMGEFNALISRLLCIFITLRSGHHFAISDALSIKVVWCISSFFSATIQSLSGHRKHVLVNFSKWYIKYDRNERKMRRIGCFTLFILNKPNKSKLSKS